MWRKYIEIPDRLIFATLGEQNGFHGRMRIEKEELSRRGFLGAATALAIFPARAFPQENVFTLTVKAGTLKRSNCLVRAAVLVPDSFAASTAAILEEGGRTLPAQLSAPALGSGAKRELSFVLPRLDAGASATFRVTLLRDPSPVDDAFAWDDKGLLSFGKRPVLQYMSAPLDESSPGAREQTYKVFHHLFDPKGERRVTKGAGGKFTHHRGIYYGFNKVTYGAGKTCDVWHCTKDAHQSHEKTLASAVGSVFGRHRLSVGWHGIGKELFAREERELTAYVVPGGILVDFASLLKPELAPVKLDGDPQHAGFHFRADGEVADKTSRLTHYIRPDGVGKPGETRNWPGQKDHVNLPWNAMSFVLGDDRYTVAMLDRPDNPKEARFSERDYGRFGSYFARTLESGQSLLVRYRLWLQLGALTPEDVASRSADFLNPPETSAS